MSPDRGGEFKFLVENVPAIHGKANVRLLSPLVKILMIVGRVDASGTE
jgi:hypothetical protein